MAPLNAFENRRDEAFEKIMELITEGHLYIFPWEYI